MQAREAPFPGELARRIRLGEERALARLISALEDGESWSGKTLRILRSDSASPKLSYVIGITGPPGSGKSTLIDKLIGAYRDRGERVAVLAVDPSSPFTGGAILGDRIRMQGRAFGSTGASAEAGVDGGVFIRSLASRGRLGGLSRASAQAARALEAAGYGIVIVETVGIGQSEVDIVRLADCVVLVSMPGSGDEIQTIKAGVMEIGDVFVVNKADRPGADRAVEEIRTMLEIGAALMSGADPRVGAEGEVGHRPSGRARSEEASAPVLKTVAASGEGLGELVAVLDAHLERAKASGELQARRRRGAIAEARTLLSEKVLGELEALEGGLEAELADEIVRGDLEATEAADILFESIRRGARNEGA